VEKVGCGAFAWSGLTKASFFGCLRSIGPEAFRSTKLKALVTGSCLKFVGVGAFAYNSELTMVDLSLSPLVALPGVIFEGCRILTKIDQPPTLERFEGWGHFRRTGLSSFDAGAMNLNEIPDHLFNGSSLHAFVFPPILRRIGNYSFRKTKQQEIDLREIELREIGMGAFGDSEELRDVRLGANVRIRSSAFGGTQRLVFFEIGDAGRFEATTFFSLSTEALNPAFVDFSLRGMRQARVEAALKNGVVATGGLVRGRDGLAIVISTAPLRGCVG
jgi:hypothetical protein